MELQVNGDFTQRTRGKHIVTSGDEMEIGSGSNQGDITIEAPRVDINP
jgi:hypothetical protein